MADYFDFNGIRSTDLGVYVTDYPDVTVAAQRIAYTAIPGRSGSLALTDGNDVYDDVTLAVNCFIRDLSNLDEIARWLHGSGELILGNTPERKRLACISQQIPLSKIFRARTAHTFAVTFRCDPFWYEVEPDVHRLPGATTIGGEGTVDSDPVIVVNGLGDCTLTVGDTVLTLTGLTGSITIDCQKRLAYSGTTSLSHLVSGAWPKLSVNGTAVSWTGNVADVIVTPNWRWL